MTIHLLQTPDQPSEWAAWLEQYVSSQQLGELVHELSLVAEADPQQSSAESLSAIMDSSQLEAIRTTGFAACSQDQAQRLMASPRCLLELQEHLITTGSTYWDDRFNEAVSRPVAAAVTQKVVAQVTSAPDAAIARPVERTDSRRTLLAIVATTAAAVLGILYWPSAEHGGSGRMLGQPGLLANDVDSSAEYFNRLADAGAEWFDQNPADSRELANLLTEVSTDCQRLIEAPHEALEPPEREWFVTKCQLWKDKFDNTLASLTAGEMSFEDAQAAADATMTKLVEVLRAGPTA